jgi:pectate lyase
MTLTCGCRPYLDSVSLSSLSSLSNHLIYSEKKKKKPINCRIRYGYAHVVNNLYQGWMQYAIGGSMNPSVKSQANLFIAPKSGNKEVYINIYIYS